MYTVQCTLYSVHRTSEYVQCTLCHIERIPCDIYEMPLRMRTHLYRPVASFTLYSIPRRRWMARAIRVQLPIRRRLFTRVVYVARVTTATAVNHRVNVGKRLQLHGKHCNLYGLFISRPQENKCWQNYFKI